MATVWRPSHWIIIQRKRKIIWKQHQQHADHKILLTIRRSVLGFLSNVEKKQVFGIWDFNWFGWFSSVPLAVNVVVVLAAACKVSRMLTISNLIYDVHLKQKGILSILGFLGSLPCHHPPPNSSTPPHQHLQANEVILWIGSEFFVSFQFFG